MSGFARVAIMLLSTSSLAVSEQPPVIGAKFKKAWRSGDVATVCMTHPAQADPCVERVFDGLIYQVAYNAQTGRVSYLHTHDQNFRTSDGLRVGDPIPVSEETMGVLPGWEIRVLATHDGWWPVVGYDLPQIKLTDETTLDLAHKDERASGMAVIVGFSKGRP